MYMCQYNAKQNVPLDKFVSIESRVVHMKSIVYVIHTFKKFAAIQHEMVPANWYSESTDTDQQFLTSAYLQRR